MINWTSQDHLSDGGHPAQSEQSDTPTVAEEPTVFRKHWPEPYDLLAMLRCTSTSSAEARAGKHGRLSFSEKPLVRTVESPLREEAVKTGRVTYISVLTTRRRRHEPTHPRPDFGAGSEVPCRATLLPIHEGIVEMAQRDVVEQLRSLTPRFGGTTPSLENLVFAYTAAAIVRSDEDEWQLFCMAPEWRRRRKKPTLSGEDRADALMYVMRFLHGTGNNVALPVQLAMRRLRPYWAANVSPFELHTALDREAPPYTGATVAVRFVDNSASRQLLAHQAGTSGGLQFKILPGKGRSKHVLEISGVHIEPL